MEGIAMDVKTKQIYLVTDTNEKTIYIFNWIDQEIWNKK